MRTRVGYSGGTKKDPTYHDLGDHSETLQLDYDPSKITFEELLNVFWQSHDPTVQPWSRQYMSIIFYHDDEQKMLALKTKEQEEKRRKAKIHTDIVAASTFHLAEDYHQKYHLRQVPQLMKEFNAFYPAPDGFVSSTAAARVNGYIAGHGGVIELKKELKSFGLSVEGSKKLLYLVSGD